LQQLQMLQAPPLLQPMQQPSLLLPQYSVQPLAAIGQLLQQTQLFSAQPTTPSPSTIYGDLQATLLTSLLNNSANLPPTPMDGGSATPTSSLVNSMLSTVSPPAPAENVDDYRNFARAFEEMAAKIHTYPAEKRRSLMGIIESFVDEAMKY
ncbi:hypothetical protein PFISCL1PPCAC_10916, partial [Pristionchus fissidentatus]